MRILLILGPEQLVSYIYIYIQMLCGLFPTIDGLAAYSCLEREYNGHLQNLVKSQTTFYGRVVIASINIKL